MLYREAISQATVQAMRDDPKVVLIGQMVTDDKGVFGTTLEAYKEFPERCIEAPVSETMLTGACVGMAMEGYKPMPLQLLLSHAAFITGANMAAKITIRRTLPFRR